MPWIYLGFIITEQNEIKNKEFAIKWHAKALGQQLLKSHVLKIIDIIKKENIYK